MDLKILIVGFGYVGKSAFEMFSRKYKVFVYDPFIARKDFPKINFVDDLSSRKFDLAVICLPTEIDQENYVRLDFAGGYSFKIFKCDTSLVEKAVKEVNSDLVLIKSTLAHKTTEKLAHKTGKQICHSPEFIGESKYHNSYDFHSDMAATPWLILGGDKKGAEKIFDIVQPIVGPQKHFYYAGEAVNAELIKTMENDFFAKKITFSNEARTLTEKIGGDWFGVREGWGLDPRVDLMHTGVFLQNRGFSGKCLPKDVMSRVYSAIVDGNYYPYFSVSMLIMNTIYNPEAMNNNPIDNLRDILSVKKITLVKGKKEKELNPKIR